MNFSPGMQTFRRMAEGAAVMLAVVLVTLHFQKDRNPAEQFAAKSRRSDLAAQMQIALASASEAEKSAVLAVTDEDSQKFADQARAASADVDRDRGELGELLKTSDDQAAKDSLAEFSKAFAEFQEIDKGLLALAVQNTNIKATSLAFGPATDALKEMDSALAQIATDDAKVLRLADAARIAAWKILAMIPPHIAEESDPKMDAMEAQMAGEDEKVRKSLDELAAIPALAGTAGFKSAVANYAQFSETRAKILKLSRENTNVRSLAISLNQKRKIMLACQAALTLLQQAIEAEPVAGIARETAKPR